MSLFPPIDLEELIAGCGVVYLDKVYGKSPVDQTNVTLADYGTYVEADNPANLDLVFRFLTRVKSWDFSVQYGIVRVTTDSNNNLSYSSPAAGGTYTATLIGGSGVGYVDNEANRVLATSQSQLGVYNGTSVEPGGPTVGVTAGTPGNPLANISLQFGLLRNGAKQSISDFLIGFFYLQGSVPITVYVANDNNLAFDSTGTKFYDSSGDTTVPPLIKNIEKGLSFLGDGRRWNIQGSGTYCNNPNYNGGPDPNHPTAGEIGAYVTLLGATLTEKEFFTWGGLYDPNTGRPV